MLYTSLCYMNLIYFTFVFLFLLSLLKYRCIFILNIRLKKKDFNLCKKSETDTIQQSYFGGLLLFQLVYIQGRHGQDSFQTLQNKTIYNLDLTFNRLARVDLKGLFFRICPLFVCFFVFLFYIRMSHYTLQSWATPINYDRIFNLLFIHANIQQLI